MSICLKCNKNYVNKKLADWAGRKSCDTKIAEKFLTKLANIVVIPLFHALSHTTENKLLSKPLWLFRTPIFFTSLIPKYIIVKEADTATN